MEAFSVYAPAKINLTLDLIGRRPDGYHELRTVMQTIGLSDELRFNPFVAAPFEGTTRFSCSRPDLQTEENLAYRAVLLMRAAAAQKGRLRRHDGLALHLEKRIPAAAGLGGGSSDAAAVLRALNRIWRLGLRREELEEAASALGSDVPFFVRGGTALAEGRGERIRSLPAPPRRCVLLITFAQGLSTASVYAAAGPNHFGGRRSERLVQFLTRPGRGAGRRSGDKALEPWEHWIGNDLAEAALQLRPELRAWLTLLRRTGASAAEVSGSGPSLFALYPDEASARRAVQSLAEAALPGKDETRWYLTRFAGPAGAGGEWIQQGMRGEDGDGAESVFAGGRTGGPG